MSRPPGRRDVERVGGESWHGGSAMPSGHDHEVGIVKRPAGRPSMVKIGPGR